MMEAGNFFGTRMFMDDAIRLAGEKIEKVQRRLDSEDNGYNARLTCIEARLALLEAFRDKEAVQTKLKEQAAQQQATCGNSRGPIKTYDMKREPVKADPPADLYAPLRNDTKAVLDLAAFARRLLDPHDLGWAVSAEVRSLAFEALGLAKK